MEREREDTVKTYVVQEGFILRAGKAATPGEELQLTTAEARSHLFYGRIRLKPPDPEPEEDDGVDVETRDPEAAHRDPRPRRRR